jgi:superfamily I DNA/RNA helicase
MCLNLPQYTQLDDDQKKVYTLPLSGRNVISGPPGTGKSVIAIHRAAAMAKKGKLPTILMFNKMLQLWTAKALEEAGKMADLKGSAIEKLESKTTEAWFKQWFSETFGVAAPTVEVKVLPSKQMRTKFAKTCKICNRPTTVGVDWAVAYPGKEGFHAVHEPCLERLNTKMSKDAYKAVDFQACVQVAEPHMEAALEKASGIDVLIDEGQDLPNSAYLLLSEFCESLTVYLDSAQTVTENKSTEEEISEILEVADDRRQILKKNYRNGREVHQLAEKFRPRHLVVAETPKRECSDKPKLIGFNSQDAESTWVATLGKNYANLSLGVFVRTKKRRDFLAHALSIQGVAFQVYNPDAYDPDVREESFDPCRKGITLATQNNAKGLEFDIVVAAGMDEWPSKIQDWLFGQFYVLITRSRDRLYLSYVGKSKNDLPLMMTSDRFKPLISDNLIDIEFRQ